MDFNSELIIMLRAQLGNSFIPTTHKFNKKNGMISRKAPKIDRVRKKINERFVATTAQFLNEIVKLELENKLFLDNQS